MTIRRLLAASLALAAPLSILASCGTKTEPTASAEQIQRGHEAYLAYCAVCHGDRGAGDGDWGYLLRGTGSAVARLDDQARANARARDELRRVIAEGGAHTKRSNLMPGWAEKLEAPVIDDIVAFVLTLPGGKMGASEATIQKYLEAPAGVPADGRRIYLHFCSACHGPHGKGDGPYANSLRQQHNIRPRDLTDTTYVGRKTDEELFAVISLGGGHMGKSPYMPAWTVSLTPEQVKDVVSYVRAIGQPAHP
jgi:mono/diheme cytochrome c family protein